MAARPPLSCALQATFCEAMVSAGYMPVLEALAAASQAPEDVAAAAGALAQHLAPPSDLDSA